jgi:hypothetical protein
VFHRLLELAGLAIVSTPKTEEELASEIRAAIQPPLPAIDAEYIHISDHDNTIAVTPSVTPRLAEMKHILREMAAKHAQILQKKAQTAPAGIEPSFSIKISPLQIHTNISPADKLISPNNPAAAGTWRYHRLGSEDFTKTDIMNDSPGPVETVTEKKHNMEELIAYYNEISPKFDKLKERFQSISMLQVVEQTTILFPTLQEYQPASPSLNFRKMSNLIYLNKKAQDLANNFNNYIDYNLPKIKMHREMIENDQIDDKTVKRAHTIGFECAEQMRRTSYSVLDLLEKTETFNKNIDAAGNTMTKTLSDMARKLNDARRLLQGLHTSLDNYQINKQNSQNSAELERTPLLVSTFR